MIQSIVIEIRPGLRTCSVCLVLKESVKNAKIKVRKNLIVFYINDRYYNVPLKDFEVEPSTITCFAAENEIVTFRIDISNCPLACLMPRLKKVLPLPPNQSVKISCKCGCPITEDMTFKRVLPLPSHGIELADMFCHYDSCSSASISPRPGDCLYSTHYITVRKDILKNVKINSVIKCSRCLASLGLHKNETVQLWSVCLDIPNRTIDPEEEFKRIIRHAIEESFVLFLKIFLECVESNSGLLISVVDKQLLVSRANENLQLKISNVLKLKYEYYNVCTTKLRTILEKEDIQCIDVPHSVLSEGLTFLMKSSEEIPPQFRTVDGELMAYLDISS